MPALPADIAAAMRPAAVETWSDPAILARYPSARDGRADPGEGFFDEAADADAAVAARAILFGTERRHFTVSVADPIWPAPEDGIMLIALSDPEQSASGNHIPARIELSLEAETTSYEVFG